MKLKRTFLPLIAIIAALFFSAPAQATGFHTCAATERDDWVSVDDLKKKVAADGFEYRRHKPDGGCYEVYIKYTDDRVAEAYYHPVTLELEVIQRRGQVLYEKPAESEAKSEEMTEKAATTAETADKTEKAETTEATADKTEETETTEAAAEKTEKTEAAADKTEKAETAQETTDTSSSEDTEEEEDEEPDCE